MIIHCDSARYIYEVYEQGEYAFAFKDLVVMDIGCNIGTFSLWVYPYARKIYAVDCEERNVALFRKTINDNELQNIYPSVSKIYSHNDTGDIPQYSLAGYMSGNSISYVDLMKIDIEGDEVEVFLAEDFPVGKIRTIIGEYHGRPVKEILEARGYRYTEFPNYHFLARL